MKKYAILLLCIGALLVTGCKKGGEEVKTETIQDIQKREGIPVTIAPVSKGTLQHTEKLGGTVEGVQQTVLANGAGGILQKLHYGVGDEVKKGKVVATMRFDQGSPIAAANAAYNYAAQSLKRVQKLYSEGAIAKEQVEAVRAQYENAKHQLGGAKVAKYIKAAFSGTILELYQSEGSSIAAKTPLMLLADLSSVLIDIRVHDLAINDYSIGQKAYIISDNDTLRGEVIRTSMAASAMTHGYTVTVKFPNEKELLRPGMYREVYTVIDERNDALYIPTDVIQREGDKKFVYTLEGDKASKKEITTGLANSKNIEILSGLSETDKIITSGITMIGDSTKVKVVSE